MTRSLYFLIPIGVFILDRLTKVLVERGLLLHESTAVIPGFLDLTHTRNTGVAFGFFANSKSVWVPYVLALTSAVALVLILVYSLRHPVKNWKLQLGLMLVLGGAAGNFYDRISYGYVIDFIDVFYRAYHWPTFNVADSAISVGIGLLLLEVLLQKPQKDDEVKTVPVKQ
jgi:signal peptidase II